MPGLNSQVGARSALFKIFRLSVVIVLCCFLCCSVIMVLFYVVIVCTVTLPPGVNPITVDKYIYIHYVSITRVASITFDSLNELTSTNFSLH